MLVPVYTRKLRANDFGVLSLLTITFTVLTIVLKFGLNHAFFRHYYETEDPEHRRRIVGSTLIFLVLSSLGATAALWTLAPRISAAVFKGDASHAELIQLIFLISFFEVITLIPDSILRANFKSARYSALNIVAFVFQIGFISYLVIWVDASVSNVLIGRLAGTAFEAVLFYAIVFRDLSLKFSLRELRGMLAFGVPLIFGQVAFQLFMMIDRFFLEHYTNNKEVGAYSMACTLVSVVSILVTVPFSQVWTVMRFSVMNEEGAEEYYSRVLTYIVLVSMFLALGVSAVAGDGLTLYSLKSYWSAAAIIPLLGLSAVLDCASRVLNIGITMKKRTIFAPVVIAVALAANVGLNFLLIPRYGSMGATISTLLSFALFCGLRYWASNLFFKVRYEWARVLKIGAVGVVITAAFYVNDSLRGEAVINEVPNRPLLLLSLAIKTALALSFPLLLFALRFYHPREIERIGEVWRKAMLLGRQRFSESWLLLVASAGAILLLGCLMLLLAANYRG